jgi:hypothetical protein
VFEEFQKNHVSSGEGGNFPEGKGILLSGQYILFYSCNMCILLKINPEVVIVGKGLVVLQKFFLEILIFFLTNWGKSIPIATDC